MGEAGSRCWYGVHAWARLVWDGRGIPLSGVGIGAFLVEFLGFAYGHEDGIWWWWEIVCALINFHLHSALCETPALMA